MARGSTCSPTIGFARLRLRLLYAVVVSLQLSCSRSPETSGRFERPLLHANFDHGLNGSVGTLVVLKDGQYCSEEWETQAIAGEIVPEPNFYCGRLPATKISDLQTTLKLIETNLHGELGKYIDPTQTHRAGFRFWFPRALRGTQFTGTPSNLPPEIAEIYSELLGIVSNTRLGRQSEARPLFRHLRLSAEDGTMDQILVYPGGHAEYRIHSRGDNDCVPAGWVTQLSSRDVAKLRALAKEFADETVDGIQTKWSLTLKAPTQSDLFYLPGTGEFRTTPGPAAHWGSPVRRLIATGDQIRDRFAVLGSPISCETRDGSAIAHDSQ